MSEDAPYTYPGSSVLRNRLGIVYADELDVIERRMVTDRAIEGVPAGRFDLTHLRAIHQHLFQDIYDWAGKIRTVEIAKSGNQFQFRRFIETGMADIHRRLKESNFLKGLDKLRFVDAAAAIIGDVNYVHPFREGNGRTQAYYLEQLAERAGHPIDLSRIDPERWIAASRAAHKGDYKPLAEEIGRVIYETTPVCFVIHSLAHLRAALAAGEATGQPIIAISGPAASAYAGAGWFAALVRQGRAEFPDVPLTAILDCGDRGGDALAAMKAGVGHLIFTGHPEAARRLAAIAAESGVQILDRRPAAFDLLNTPDPVFAARAWCEKSAG